MDRKALPCGWNTNLGVDGEIAANIWPPHIGSEGNLIGLGLLIILVGVIIEIGVDVTTDAVC